MAEEKKEKPKGFLEGTIFEHPFSGWFGRKKDTKTPLIEQSFLYWLVVKFLSKQWDVSRALSLWIIFLGLLFVLGHQIPDLPLFALEWLAGTAPIWLPVGGAIGAWAAWVWYIRANYISGRDAILLEIKVPRDITKSPRAMELALMNLWYGSGENSFIDRAWKGQVRTWFSFEIASFGGDVHLYAWCWSAFRPGLENALYSQFPEIEISQVEDYASKLRYDPDKYAIFCTDFELEKPNAFPIRSYIDFELDKDPKEEFKIDPLAQVLEIFSSIAPHQQMWMQIVFRQTGKYGHVLRTPKKAGDEWRKQIDDEVQKIRVEASKTVTDGEVKGFPNPTWKQTEQIKNMQRHQGKLPFDVGIRAIYFGEKPKGITSAINGQMRSIWLPFANAYSNQFGAQRGHNIFDFPWQDFRNYRFNLVSRRYIDAYRRRCFFHSPWETPTSIMSNEALATIFHFPSSGISTPGLQRIPATKAEPPPNLPK